MNRRSFLKGLAGVAAGIIVPDLILPPDPEKRFWALDQAMLGTERYWESGWIDSSYDPPIIRQDEYQRLLTRFVRDAQIALDNAILYGDYDSDIGRRIQFR